MKSTDIPLRDPLEDAFFKAIGPQLVGDGWIASVEVPYQVAPIEGRYMRPSEGLVVSVTQLSYHGRGEAHRYVEAFVGVTSPRAERVLSALGTACNVTVGEYAGVLSRGTELLMSLNRDADLQPAVREARRIVQEEWPVIARNVPDIDAIIDRLRGLGDDDGTVGIQIPVILAAGGRIPEARESVRSYDRLYADADFHGFSADFESWLDAGAVVPPPSADAFPAPRALVRTEMEFTWAEAASSAAFVAYAGLCRMFGRRSEQDSDG